MIKHELTVILDQLPYVVGSEKEKIKGVVDMYVNVTQGLTDVSTELLETLTLYILCNKRGAIEYLRVFGAKEVIIEPLDTSGYRVQKLQKEKDEEKKGLKYVLIITFQGGRVQVVRGNAQDIQSLKCKKYKELRYGVTDGTEVVPVTIKVGDIRELSKGVITDLVEYTYKQKTQHMEIKKPLVCVLMEVL